MSQKRRIWAVGSPLSAVLAWFNRTAGRIADQLQMIGRTDQLQVTPLVVDFSRTLHADYAGKRVELREFTKVLNIGDRMRVLCDDGVLVAEKISRTQFKVIHTEAMAKLVH
jgi:hypothetical protein